MAYASGGTAEEQALEKATWREIANAFWQGQAAATEHQKAPLQRTKTYEWLCSAETMLRTALGEGFWAFRRPAPERNVAPELWRSLTICVDQGGDGWSGIHYLLHHQVNILPINDTSHRIWNDVCLAVRDAALHWHVAVGVQVMSLDCGPWEQQRWFQTGREAVTEMMDLSDCEDGVFQKLLKFARREMTDWTEDFDEGCDDDEVWKSLRAVFEHKMEKVAKTRWFQYVTAMRGFLGSWSRRLSVLIYVSLSLGLIKDTMAPDMMKVRVKEADPHEDIKKCSTKKDEEEVNKVRLACKNSMVFTVFMLSSRNFYYINVAVVELAWPVQKYHSDQNKLSRSAKESLEFWTAAAKDGVYEQVNGVVAKLDDEEFLKKVGLSVRGCCCLTTLELELEDPTAEAEDDRADMIGRLAMSLVARRLRSGACYNGWPFRLAALLDAEEAPKVLEQLKQQHDDYTAALDPALKGAFWKTIRERLPFRWAKMQQVLLLSAASEWRMSDKLKELVTRDFGGVTQTKLIEDGVRTVRLEETLKSTNKAMTGMRAWWSLIEDKVESEKHRFAGVVPADEVVPRGLHRQRIASLFDVAAQEVPKEFRSVVSPSRTVRM